MAPACNHKSGPGKCSLFEWLLEEKSAFRPARATAAHLDGERQDRLAALARAATAAGDDCFGK